MNWFGIRKYQVVLNMALVMTMLAAALAAWPSAAAAESPDVLTAGSVSGKAGSVIQIPITLSSYGEVEGLQFDLIYDSSLLVYQKTSLGDLITDENDSFSLNVFGAQPGKVSVIIYSLSAFIPAGTGTIARIQFGILPGAPGGVNSALEFNKVTVTNHDGNVIDTTLNNGQVSIQLSGRTITINSGQVPSPLTDFPLLVNINGDSYLRTVSHGGQVAQADGSDIYFTDSSGAIPYASEIESYDGASGTLVAWVKVPSLSDGTVVKMQYGGGSLSPNAAAVWSNNFKAVWHMDQANSTDSTAGGNHGTAHGDATPPAVSALGGRIDGTVYFNPGTTFIDCGSNSSLNFNAAGSYTWAAWINPSEFHSGGSGIIGKDPNSDYAGYEVGLGGSGQGGQLRFQTTANSSTDGMISSTTGMTLNAWTHITAVYNNHQVSLYINGVLNNSGSVNTADDLSSPLYLGWNRNSSSQSSLSSHFKGALDEIEYSNAARSADWILTQYNNQSAPDSFYTLSAGPLNLVPTIAIQPVSQTIVEGAAAAFSAAASASPAPAVQWQVSLNNGGSWGNIPGADLTALVFPKVTADMNGRQYRALFSNSEGLVTTDAVTLSVTAAPSNLTITGIAPSSGPLSGGTPVIISGTGFTGNPAVSIGGYPAGNVSFVSETSITATTPAGTPGAADVTVGSATLSGGFTYLALAIPQVTLNPADLAVTAGSRALFTARAGGNPVPSVQWQQQTVADGSTWSDIPGATEVKLILNAVTASMNGSRYKAVFTNSAGSTETGTAILTVNPAASGGVQYYRTFTLNSGAVPAPLSDFPVLVNIRNDAALKSVANGGHVANADGYDIYFTDSSGAANYACEIESYDGSSGTLAAWVKVPSLSNGAVFKMFYGGSGPSSTANVWSNGFLAVWHMNQPNVSDSTANNNHGTINGDSQPPAITSIGGQIDRAGNFVPGSTYIDCGNNSSLNFSAAGSYTWTDWINPADIHSGGSGIIGKEPGKDAENNAINYVGYDISLGGAGGTNPGQLRFQTTGDSTSVVNSTIGIPKNTWTHIAVVYTNGNVSLYINGEINNSGVVITADDSSSPLYLGWKRNSPSQGTVSAHLMGALDEIQYSSAARSAAWIQAEYHNQSAPASFYSLSSETPVSSSSGGTGGGGGGGGNVTTVALHPTGFANNPALTLNNRGLAESAAHLTTVDGAATLDIAAKTQLLTSSNAVLSSLTVSALNSPPAPSSGNALILAYSFGPQGSKFSPAVTLTMSYNPSALPVDLAESNLYLAFFDGTQWQALESTVNTQNHTVSTPVTHFSDYALLGKLTPPVTTQTQTTAPVSTPSQTAQPLLSNTTPTPSGSQTLIPAASPSVINPSLTSVNPGIGKATPIPSTTPPASKEPSGSTNWTLISSIIAAVVVVTVVVVLVLGRRRKKTQ